MKEPKGQHSPKGKWLEFFQAVFGFHRFGLCWKMTPAVLQDAVAPHQVLVVFHVLQVTLSPDYYRT